MDPLASGSKAGDGDGGGGDGGGGGRIFPVHPGPIPNAPRDNISRKGIPSLRFIQNRHIMAHMVPYAHTPGFIFPYVQG